MRKRKSDKDVIISISGVMNFDDADGGEKIELMTEGKYSFMGGCGHLSYLESEITGMEGTRTSLFFSPNEVVLKREGTMTSHMIFREGFKNSFLYETPYGQATMGLNTHKIKSTLGENGGDMEIDYVVDFDHAMVGRNKFCVNVREQEVRS